MIAQNAAKARGNVIPAALMIPMMKNFERHKCTKIEMFEGYRQYYINTLTMVKIKPFNDDLLFKALIRHGVKTDKKDQKTPKNPKGTVEEFANVQEMRKIGAGAKIRR